MKWFTIEEKYPEENTLVLMRYKDAYTINRWDGEDWDTNSFKLAHGEATIELRHEKFISWCYVEDTHPNSDLIKRIYKMCDKCGFHRTSVACEH